MFITRVERNFEAAHTNGPPEGRCATMHGHSWQVSVEVHMLDQDLDEWGWSMDFIVIKKIIDQYDHKTLNEFFDKPSAEHISQEIYRQIIEAAGGRARSVVVEIAEGVGNTLTYLGPDA